MPEEKLSISAINFGEEFDSKGEFELIDDGKYEVTIDKIEPKISSKGNKYLNVTFKIRDDVEQKFKNRKLFYRINAKEGDATGYDFNRLNKLIITQKNTSNYKKYFTDVDEVLQYLVGLHLVITVETAFDDYNQKERNNVKDWAFEPSVWDTQEHPTPIIKEHTEALEETAKEAEKVLDLPDDDLPF
jgi:hypothetical protein